ncbi:2-hydroxyacid dehydrogenase [Nitrosococcus watsonii]|uniref:D-isomer specific 2-hydroxyacid dehydrogenase NAD-binding protein n=1 Tax=Nitrosococcus watsoni (strain C-113) TaxID=105559 RepID=D8KBZ1_NITWC|nr:2-hydroxyacid dehydrogenase [Nitrosococcus watsonii]ADJ27752.1 D-isomer specific 2-hydroxyacid dehydrogenase NAD-binding protein [Nitrosococcus watsonii C-113]
MKIAVCSAQPYDRQFLLAANRDIGHELVFFETSLCEETQQMVRGFPAVCVFVNDRLNAAVLNTLAGHGTRLIALRCAGFNNVDILTANDLGLYVVRVPAYSPHSVAEHSVALILALNRHLHRAYNRVRNGNFALQGLLGFELRGKTVGIVGTGHIGSAVAGILHGFGCRLIAHDPQQNAECLNLGVEYVSLERLCAVSDIITLHCPLTPDTHYLIGTTAIACMKQGVMLINTSRGAVVDTRAVIEGLKSAKIGALGIDVYEQEGDLFFQDLSERVIQDDIFGRLLTFPNVLITGHQGFFTEEALASIAQTTLQNISIFERDGVCENAVTMELLR